MTHDPQADAAAFRRALGEFATGVTVVTTRHQGQDYGVTSNSFASVSLDPPLILWSIKRNSQSLEAFQHAAHFVVNVLASAQIPLSQRFARSGGDKFEGLDFARGDGEVPLLAGSAVTFECRLAEIRDGGDHLILIGQVMRFQRHDRQPLLFAKGRYALATDHPDLAPPTVAGAAEPGQTPLTQLLVRAYGAIASHLEQGRREAGLGLSLMEARLLRSIGSHPGARLSDLARELLVPPEMGEALVEALVRQGLVQGNGGALHLTPAGTDQLASVMDHAAQSEARLFQDLSPADLATTRGVLQRLAEAG